YFYLWTKASNFPSIAAKTPGQWTCAARPLSSLSSVIKKLRDPPLTVFAYKINCLCKLNERRRIPTLCLKNFQFQNTLRNVGQQVSVRWPYMPCYSRTTLAGLMLKPRDTFAKDFPANGQGEMSAFSTNDHAHN